MMSTELVDEVMDLLEDNESLSVADAIRALAICTPAASTHFSLSSNTTSNMLLERLAGCQAA